MADRGPANTLYVPGALLAPCANDIVILELNCTSYLPGGAMPAGAHGIPLTLYESYMGLGFMHHPGNLDRTLWRGGSAAPLVRMEDSAGP